MRSPSPDWKQLAARYGNWIPEADLKYHTDAVHRAEVIRDAEPILRPAELEIGSNRGRFLRGLCHGRPDVHFYGIEIKRKLVRIAQRRLDRHELHNGRALRGDARIVVPVVFGEASLAAVYVLFPDPWWKSRHAKRRLLSFDFLRVLSWALEPGGVLVLRTDVRSYAEQVRTDLSALSDRYHLIDEGEVPGSDTWELSTRHRHCLEDGIVVHSLFARTSP